MVDITLRVADFGIGGVAANQGPRGSGQARGVSQRSVSGHGLAWGAHAAVRLAPADARGTARSAGRCLLPRSHLVSDSHRQPDSGSPRGDGRWTGRPSWPRRGVPAGTGRLAFRLPRRDEPARSSRRRGRSWPSFGTRQIGLGSALPASLPAVADSASGATCPDCGGAMKVRMNKHGGSFLGCAAFPSCRGTRPLPRELVDPPAAPARGATADRAAAGSRSSTRWGCAVC